MDILLRMDRELVLLAAFLIFIFFSFLYLLAMQRRMPKLNLVDMLTNEDGRYVSTKFFQFGAFVVTTFALVMAIVKGTASYEFILGYAGLWGGLAAYNKKLTSDTLGTPAKES